MIGHSGVSTHDVGDGRHDSNRIVRDVTVVEVGPRDGLQNEANSVPTAAKVAFVDALSDAGLPIVEVTSFVHPKLVPQLADAAEVMAAIHRSPGVRYPVLVPNEQGLARALDADVDAIALFTAASEAFASANVAATIDETFERFAPVVAHAATRNIWIRGYISVSFGCPYSGAVSASAVAAVAERLLTLGCDEICLADTIGVATSRDVQHTLSAMQQIVPIQRLALHFHDTSGNALRNVEAGLDYGVRIFDSAAGGLGGCPFAPGAPGNLATEDLIAMLDGAGLRTGVAVEGLTRAVAILAPYLTAPRFANA